MSVSKRKKTKITLVHDYVQTQFPFSFTHTTLLYYVYDQLTQLMCSLWVYEYVSITSHDVHVLEFLNKGSKTGRLFVA